MQDRMEYLKCKKCGGLILRENAVMYSCMICDTQYHTSEVNDYTQKTNFAEGVAGILNKAFNSGNDIMAVNAINDFLDTLSKDLISDGSYEIEHYMLLLCQEKIKEYGDDFIEWPWDFNTSKKYINSCRKITDFVYSVCSQTHTRISYDYIMGYASYCAYGIAKDGWNCEMNSRWKKYIQDEESLKELIAVGDNCIDALKQFDVYGNVCFDYVYEFMVRVHQNLCETTFPHEYWDGYSYVTEKIGLTTFAKQARNQEKLEIENKLSSAKKKKDIIKRKIIAEENRIEAEKKTKRIKKFWESNKELKNKLEKEKITCEESIKELNQEKDAINATVEINEIKEEIRLINSTLATLGFFNFKQKKEKRETITKLEREIEALKVEVNKKKKAIQDKIDTQIKRIAEIENEFTKDRL